MTAQSLNQGKPVTAPEVSEEHREYYRRKRREREFRRRLHEVLSACREFL
jgi:hypothetical protein